jgi:uncharacterized membrane protein
MTGFEALPTTRLEIGGILNRTCSALKDNPTFFLSLAALAALPTTILDFLGFPQNWPVNSLTAGGALLASIISVILSLMIQGAIAHGVFRSFQGREPSFCQALSYLLDQFGSLLVAALFMFVAIGLGLLLFIIPGIILSCGMIITIQACVVEGLGPMDSLSRSWELTRGHRWRLFVLGVVWFLVYLGSFILSGLLIGFVVGDSPSVVVAAAMVAEFGIDCLLGAGGGILAAIIFYDLRSIKEGLTIDNLAQVFD